jgi:hypothetical protein
LALGPTRNGWFGGSLFAGIGTAGLGGGRSIADCIDCRSDDLQLLGGTFWRVGADLTFPTERGGRWGFTASYQGYLGDASLDDEFLVSLARWW